MIVGTGTDIVQIDRIQAAYQRNPKFAQRILAAEEMHVFQTRYDKNNQLGIRYLALRFAAKEAFAKAMGLGIRDIMHWHAIQVLNDELGKPYFEYDHVLGHYLQSRQWHAHVSLSDEAAYGLAFVVLESSS